MTWSSVLISAYAANCELEVEMRSRDNPWSLEDGALHDGVLGVKQCRIHLHGCGGTLDGNASVLAHRVDRQSLGDL
jgi:hypothetical protein